MIATGERVPSVPVWREAGGDSLTLDSLAVGGPFFLVFYLYDWSST